MHDRFAVIGLYPDNHMLDAQYAIDRITFLNHVGEIHPMIFRKVLLEFFGTM